MAVMAERPTYRVECRRAGRWWALKAPEVPGVHTQSRRLDRAEDMARDAIALVLDVSPDSFDVRLEHALPDELQGKVVAAVDAGAQARQAADRASAATREAVATLLHAGLTVRDAGRLLESARSGCRSSPWPRRGSTLRPRSGALRPATLRVWRNPDDAGVTTGCVGTERPRQDSGAHPPLSSPVRARVAAALALSLTAALAGQAQAAPPTPTAPPDASYFGEAWTGSTRSSTTTTAPRSR